MSVALAVSALIGAVLLLFEKERVFPIVAVVVAGIEVLRGLGILHIGLQGFPLRLILGALLLVAGVVCHAKAAGKLAVSAATVLVFVGLLQVLAGLGALS